MLKSIYLLAVVGIALQSAGHDFQTNSRYQFGRNLAQKIQLSNLHKNLILSPASIQTSLALTYMGARGETEAELKKCLILDEYKEKQQVAEDYHEFLTALRGNGKHNKAKVHMANRIFLGQKYDISSEFSAVAKKYFNSDAERVDFGKKEDAAKTINHWIDEATHHHIKHAIQSDSLNDNTAAVLVNAIHFKGEWKSKFDPSYTENRIFHVSDSIEKKVPTMHRENAHVRYCNSAEYDAAVVELPYKHSDLSMLIVVPNKVDGLKSLIESYDVKKSLELSKCLKEQTVDIYLPKFNVKFDMSLVDTLKSMGLSKPFADDADFSGMLKTDVPLKISDVRHTAFIKVDEKGSEAAGSTFVQITGRSSRVSDVTLRVDRPFVFAIKDAHAVYFTGHVVDFD